MVKSFPNTVCYNTYFEPGASGNFLTTLIYKFLYGSLPHVLSTYGSTHNRYHVLYSNFRLITPLKQPRITDIYFSDINPIDITRPVLLLNHGNPNLVKFFNTFPIGTIIKIMVPKEMKARMFINQLYKNILEDYETTEYAKKLWIDWRRMFDYLKNLENPKTLTSEEIVNYFTGLEYDDEVFEVPDEYAGNVLLVSYKEIIYNKNVVLDIISNLTNKPITDHLHEYYDSYLSKQNELLTI